MWCAVADPVRKTRVHFTADARSPISHLPSPNSLAAGWHGIERTALSTSFAEPGRETEKIKSPIGVVYVRPCYHKLHFFVRKKHWRNESTGHLPHHPRGVAIRKAGTKFRSTKAQHTQSVESASLQSRFLCEIDVGMHIHVRRLRLQHHRVSNTASLSSGQIRRFDR
jgi:hypothetical protein